MLFCSNDGTIQRLLLLLNSNIFKKRCFIWWKLRSYIFYVQKIVFAQCECMCNAIFFCLFRLNKMKRHSKENSKACSCTNQIFNIEKIEMCTFGWTYSRITIQQIPIFCYSFVTICFFFVIRFEISTTSNRCVSHARLSKTPKTLLELVAVCSDFLTNFFLFRSSLSFVVLLHL